MPESSWRNILDRAASNLSIELDRTAGPVLQHQPHAWRPARHSSQGASSSVERCDLLARELEALCRPERRPQIPQTRGRAAQFSAATRKAPGTQLVVLPAVKKQPKKSNAARELAALSISVAVVVLAIYGFLFLLK